MKKILFLFALFAIVAIKAQTVTLNVEMGAYDADQTFTIYNNGNLHSSAGSVNSDANVIHGTGNAVQIKNVPVTYGQQYNFSFKIVGTDGVISNASNTSSITIPEADRLNTFKVADDERSKVYFNSSTGVTKDMIEFYELKDVGTKINTGYVAGSAATITDLHFNNGSTTGHYFTLSRPLKWYENINIKLGDNITLKNFNIHSAKNNVKPPLPSQKTYYINLQGSDSNDGLTEATAYLTIEKGLRKVRAGDKLWIKAGNYTGDDDVKTGDNFKGTVTEPIFIEGYKNTPGDITTNYYVYGVGQALDPTQMPTITGSTRGVLADNWKYGLMMGVRSENIIIKNLQIQNFRNGIFTNAESKNIILENINIRNVGEPGVREDGGVSTKIGVGMRIGYDTNGYETNHTRLINCNVINAEQRAYSMVGNNIKLYNCNAYSDEAPPIAAVDLPQGTTAEQDIWKTADRFGTDYYYLSNGNNNAYIHCFADKHRNKGHNGHGFSFKYKGQYNVMDDCQAININWSFQTRYATVKYNVMKNSKAIGDVPYRMPKSVGLINVTEGANHNVYRNLSGTMISTVFDFLENSEHASNNIATDNLFEDIKASNIDEVVFHFRNARDNGVNGVFSNNKFDRLDITESPFLYRFAEDTAPLFFNNNRIINAKYKCVDRINESYTSGLPRSHYPANAFIYTNLTTIDCQ